MLDHFSSADPQDQWNSQTENKLREGHAGSPIIDGFGQFRQIGLLLGPKFRHLCHLAGEGLHHTNSGDVLLDDRAHRAVLVVDPPPARLKTDGKIGHGQNRRDHGHQGQFAQGGVDGENEKGGSHKSRQDVDREQEADENEFLQAKNIRAGPRDEFPSPGIVMPGEALSLEGIIDRRAYIAESPLGGNISQRAEQKTDDRSGQHQSEKHQNRDGQIMVVGWIGFSVQVADAVEVIDRISQELRQRQLDTDVENQETNRQRHPTLSAPEKTRY